MHMLRALGCGSVALCVAIAGGFGLSGCGKSNAGTPATPQVTGGSREEMGKYIVEIGGCHDCHTPGVMEGKLVKNIAEDQWLTGSALGFNGPWGTTYASNLRQKLAAFNRETFIEAMRKRDGRPPMPWASLHAMTDEDLGAVFAYIRSLPVTGVAAPEPLTPDKVPPQPFIVMVPGVSPAFPPAAASGPATAPAPAVAPR